MKYIISTLNKSDARKTKLTMAINFMCFKVNDEEQVMQSKNNNINIMVNNEVDEVVKEPFVLLLSRFPIGLETTMRGGNFIFDYLDLL